ncbi:helix-turn-helix domain-containing protein [Streptomyces sp. NPDC090741]|uniref:helix-turn-helix domain-containing protein n=1 Tax=Streptomyces sp. NPDC090741 TaxID=3365967 RepID=UPI0038259258
MWRLALGLRHARHTAHLTYNQLAENADGFSRPTLQRATPGKTLPTGGAVTAYAKACGTAPGPFLALREAAAKDGAVRTPRPAWIELKLTRAGV